MKIIDNIQLDRYKKWVCDFVAEVIKQSHIHCEEIIIDDIDDERIYLLVDNQEYNIRTWNFTIAHRDSNGIPNAENVDYTLFQIINDRGEEICIGNTTISWDNS